MSCLMVLGWMPWHSSLFISPYKFNSKIYLEDKWQTKLWLGRNFKSSESQKFIFLNVCWCKLCTWNDLMGDNIPFFLYDLDWGDQFLVSRYLDARHMLPVMGYNVPSNLPYNCFVEPMFILLIFCLMVIHEVTCHLSTKGYMMLYPLCICWLSLV